MTENDLDGNAPTGLPGQPTQKDPGKATSADSSGEVTLANVSKQLSELLIHLRTQQSGKDKTLHNVAVEIGSISEQMKRYDNYLKRYETPDEAARQMKIDDLLANQTSTVDVPPTPQPSATGNRTEVASVIPAELLNNLGLSPNDAEVARALDNGVTPEALVQIAAIATKRKQQPATSANPASVMPTTGGTSLPAAETLESVTAALLEAMKNPVVNRAKIVDLQAKQRNLLPH